MVDAYYFYFYHSDRKCHVTLSMLAINIYFNDIIISIDPIYFP